MRPQVIRQPLVVASAALALMLAFACDNQPTPFEPGGARRPALHIADATRDYKPGFFWLPPIVRQPAYTGSFDAALAPTVEICELAGDVCGVLLATYTTTSGPNGELVRLEVDDEHYQVNWHTNDFDLSATLLYRISVRAGIDNTLLGYADVQPVSNGSGLKKVDTDEYIGLVDGRTLPIKFRIETGIVARVRVEPATATVEPGDAQQFSAVVTDLHGNVMAADVSWSSSSNAVATVNETGLATAVEEGEATITATAARVSGSATLIVDRIIATVEVEPSAAEVEPGLTRQFTATARDRHGNVMSTEFTWASSNEAAATVDQTGMATGINDGEATITASAEGKSGSGILTVRRIVGSVEVQPIEVELEPAATQQFIAIVRDRLGNIMSADVTWASSDDAVATVNQTGLATAVDDGTATITATAGDESGSATLTVEGGVVVVSPGRGHACALNPDGRAYCWGSNSTGQLGNGTTSSRLSPTAVSGGHTFKAISAGDFHTCALTTDGKAYCWGNNQSAELGDLTFTRRLTPVPVAGGHTFVSIAAGARNSCAITAANVAYCWGEGGFGAVGNNSSAFATSPQSVSGGHAFASISVGQQFVCAVTTSGAGYCWGHGGTGKLGNGSTDNRFIPVAVSGSLIFASIDAGLSHACGVTTSEQGYCWGLNQFGRLGNGTNTDASTPQLVSGGHDFVSISAGGVHSCAVTAAGKGYCWGGNIDGSIGDGSTFSKLTPSPVAGNLTWASIHAGGLIGPDFGGSSPQAFSCGVTVENQTYCWGSGFSGQLGIGVSTFRRLTPTAVLPFP